MSRKMIYMLLSLLVTACTGNYYDDYYTYNSGYYANYYPRESLFKTHVPNGFGSDGLYIFPLNEFQDLSDKIRYLDATWSYDLMTAVVKTIFAGR